ncbi:MAG: GNAT family N-acetyltransferase [Nitrososphaerales archaeon]
MREGFRFRKARPADRKNIERLCLRAVGTHDYVLGILPSILKDGNLFLAFHGDELVGMSSFTALPDKSGWLGMARTDPKWRGKGVAQFLQRKLNHYAKQRGITVLRFFVLHTNNKSLRAARKGGFEPVSEAMHVFRRIKRKEAKKKVGVRKANLTSKQLNKYLLGMKDSLLPYKYWIIKPSLSLLTSIQKNDELFTFKDAMFIFAKENKRAFFSIIRGAPKKVLSLVIAQASQDKISLLEGLLPASPPYSTASKELGFSRSRWGRHLIVFQKETSL